MSHYIEYTDFEKSLLRAGFDSYKKGYIKVIYHPRPPGCRFVISKKALHVVFPETIESLNNHALRMWAIRLDKTLVLKRRYCKENNIRQQRRRFD